MKSLRKILIPEIENLQVNYATLLLRMAFGGLMMRYGIIKMVNFEEYAVDFLDIFGIGSAASLTLAIFAEFFCSLLFILGLGTRVVLVPLIFTMLVAFFIAHADDPFQLKEHPLVFLFPFLAVFLMGPGKFSLDYLLFGGDPLS